MTEKRLFVDEDYNIVDTVTGEWLDDTQVFDLANKLAEENEQLKQAISDWKGSYDELYENYEKLDKENEQLKKDRFICLDCEYSGYTEIGCLCEKKDHWIDYKTECEDYEEFE